MARRDAEPADPMHVETPLRAVQRPRSLHVCPHLEELESEHLRVNRDRMRATAGCGRLVDKLTRPGGLLRDGVDGVLEDLAFSASHVREGQNVSPTCWKPV
jgi:hypothetical protein